MNDADRDLITVFQCARRNWRRKIAAGVTRDLVRRKRARA
jgi:hypothetical protein